VVAGFSVVEEALLGKGKARKQSEDPMGEGLAPALGCLLGAL
jgi:hypothetical protein